MWRVLISKQARKQVKKLPDKDQQKLIAAWEFLAFEPHRGKKMRGEHKGKYSLRVWPYRIIYKIEKKKETVYVLSIGHRQGVYGR